MHPPLIPSQRSNFPGEGVLVPNSAQLGLWIFLATVTMLFASFTSAYIVRSASPDWRTTPLPVILWASTVILILSSITLEVSRSARKRADSTASKSWFVTTMVLGFLFLGGQLAAWQQLMARGFYVPTNPHSSFFYVLTGLHGLHLLGGLLLLLFVFRRELMSGEAFFGSSGRDRTAVCATYWHFLAALWIFLFGMLSLW